MRVKKLDPVKEETTGTLRVADAKVLSSIEKKGSFVYKGYRYVRDKEGTNMPVKAEVEEDAQLEIAIGVGFDQTVPKSITSQFKKLNVPVNRLRFHILKDEDFPVQNPHTAVAKILEASYIGKPFKMEEIVTAALEEIYTELCWDLKEGSSERVASVLKMVDGGEEAELDEFTYPIKDRDAFNMQLLARKGLVAIDPATGE